MVAQKQQWTALRSISLPDSFAFESSQAKPECLLERLGGETIADRQAECAVCFEPLCMCSIAVLVGTGGRRVCPHIFHRECANDCPKKLGCPICRTEYNEVADVPPLSSPVEWFETMDINRNGQLELREVMYAVRATLPVDVEVLEAVLPELWSTWGKDEGDSLTFKELLGTDGLLWLLQDSLKHDGPRILHTESEVGSCPDFETNKFGWFTHWDVDGSGLLEREEVVRGLVKSFRSDVSSQVCRKRLRMRRVLEDMWPQADVDATGKISLHEFVREGGLGDMILQQFQVKRSSSAPCPRSPRPKRSPRSSQRRASRGSSVQPAGAPVGVAADKPPRIGIASNQAQGRSQGESSTDVGDTGEEESPMLLRRASKGFSLSSTPSWSPDNPGKRRNTAQWASAFADLSKFTSEPTNSTSIAETNTSRRRSSKEQRARTRRLTNPSRPTSPGRPTSPKRPTSPGEAGATRRQRAPSQDDPFWWSSPP